MTAVSVACLFAGSTLLLAILFGAAVLWGGDWKREALSAGRCLHAIAAERDQASRQLASAEGALAEYKQWAQNAIANLKEIAP